MPRYYFHVSDGRDYPDLQGTELANLATARKEALRFASALLAELPDTFWTGGDWLMTVADASRLTLFELRFMATDAPSIARRVPDG